MSLNNQNNNIQNFQGENYPPGPKIEKTIQKTETEQRFDKVESTLLKIMEKLEALDKPQPVSILTNSISDYDTEREKTELINLKKMAETN